MPSTVIASASYNIETRILKIKFVSGFVYAYKDVPEEIYNQLRTSKSKGIYFNMHIKDKYFFEKVKEIIIPGT
jgi:hypothetical protein